MLESMGILFSVILVMLIVAGITWIVLHTSDNAENIEELEQRMDEFMTEYNKKGR